MQANAYEEGLRLSAEGRHAEAIDRLQAALTLQPNDTRVLFALGNEARALEMPVPAERFFRMVLALEPWRLEALINLANLLRTNGDASAAIALLTPVLARTPESSEILLTLGSAYREQGDTARAEALYREALALRPGYLQALVNLADLLANAGAAADAQKFYARALALDPGNPAARFHRAVLSLEQGDLAKGWRDYEARLAVEPILHDHGLPRWNGERGVKLLVTAEQGVGDELMFASVISDLAKRCPVVLECDKRLVPLFARSFPAVELRAAHIQKIGAAIHALHQPSGADASIEMGSLPLTFRNTRPDFPNPNAYLVCDAEEKARWRKIFAGGPHIGICWRSGKQTNGRAIHYAPLEMWADFIRALPGTIVCAQYDASAAEIAELERRSGRTIAVPANIDQKNELDRTCAMLCALDCVVSAPTAVSWLAAGAGVPVHKILYRRSWTSFGTDHEPFAPSCRCIVPDNDGDWANAFGKALDRITAQWR